MNKRVTGMCENCVGITEDNWGLVLDLLQRAGIHPDNVHPDSDGRHYKLMLDVAALVIEHCDPELSAVGDNWFRDYFMATGEPPMEVLDEVNPPEKVA